MSPLLLALVALDLSAVTEVTTPTWSRCAEARAVVDRAVAAHGGIPGEAIAVHFEATHSYHGDSSAADLLRQLDFSGGYGIASDGRSGHRWYHVPGRSDTTISHWSADARVTVARNGAKIRLRDDDDDGIWWEGMTVLPQTVLAHALERSHTLRPLGEDRWNDRDVALVSLSDGLGGTMTLYVDVETDHLVRVERLHDYHGSGDAMETVTFDDFVTREGRVVPTSRVDREVTRQNDKYAEMTLSFDDPGDVTAATATPADSLLAELDPDLADAVRAIGAPALPWTWTEITPVIHLLEVVDGDCRVMAARFADHTVVFEAPLSSEIGGRVLDEVRAHWPDHPVRYVVSGHHHNHYVGGLRPFVADGVTVVVAARNRAFVEHLMAWPHTIDPDDLCDTGIVPTILEVTDRHVFEDETLRVELLDIGEHSSHCDAYLVAWVPAHGLVFQGDLAGFPEEGRPYRGSRARGLLAGLDERGIPAERIATAWPREGMKAVGTVAELRAAIDETDAAREK